MHAVAGKIPSLCFLPAIQRVCNKLEALLLNGSSHCGLLPFIEVHLKQSIELTPLKLKAF